MIRFRFSVCAEQIAKEKLNTELAGQVMVL